MCGIVGIVSKTRVNQALYDALLSLQHRGQDAAGMVTCDHDVYYMRKGNGLVRDVFQAEHMRNLRGNMGMGHVRYPTAGTDNARESQPFYVNSPYGITLAHNGTLTNTTQLAKEIFETDLRHVNTSSDSEVLLNILAHELQQLHVLKPNPADFFKALEKVYERCRGAYAVVAMITGYGILAFRDPNGIRPLVYGVRETKDGKEYMVASESCALDAQGFEKINDVAPGEALFITHDGQIHQSVCAKQTALHTCIFEYVYLSRPDSTLDNILVYKVRMRLGEHLADKIKREWPEHDIDVVIPIPDTSRTSAYTLSKRLGLKYREGFVKNRYIGRTFIMPGQQLRRKSVRQKLNAMELEFRDKNVLLVDDSIVRGTTCKEIIKMAREAGAKKVYFASAAPEVRYPNVYGIDMPACEELIAHNHSVEEIQKIIGADGLIYQDLASLVSAAQEGNANINRFEDSVFTGDYLTGDVDDAYLKVLAQSRSQKSRDNPRWGDEVVGDNLNSLD